MLTQIETHKYRKISKSFSLYVVRLDTQTNALIVIILKNAQNIRMLKIKNIIQVRGHNPSFLAIKLITQQINSNQIQLST